MGSARVVERHCALLLMAPLAGAEKAAVEAFVKSKRGAIEHPPRAPGHDGGQRMLGQRSCWSACREPDTVP